MIICTFKDEERRLARHAIKACNKAYNCDLSLVPGEGDRSETVWNVVGDDMLVTPAAGARYSAYVTAYVEGMEKALERIALHLSESLAGAIL